MIEIYSWQITTHSTFSSTCLVFFFKHSSNLVIISPLGQIKTYCLVTIMINDYSSDYKNVGGRKNDGAEDAEDEIIIL